MSIDAPKNKADTYSPQSKHAARSDKASSPPSNPGQPATSPDKPATSLESINIKVGQAIQAKVVEVLNVVSSRTAQNSFNVTLEIGGEKLAVKTNVALQPGQTIDLIVNAKGELILPKPTKTDTAALIAALSKVLPYQQPVGKVITALLQNLPTIGSENTQVKQLTEQLTSLLPKSANFLSNSNSSNQLPGGQTSAGQLVKQAMSQSGIFMESKLALASQQSSPPPASNASQNSSLISNTTAALAQAIKSVTSNPSTSANASTTSTTTSANTTSTLSLTGTLATPSAAAPTDLKSTVSQLINTLNSVYAAKHSATGEAPRFMAESDPALLVNPFNFPSTSHSIKSTSQNDRELSVGDLLKRLAGALNRIQFQQLNSLYQAQSASTDTTTVQTWQMELPFLSPQNQIDSVQLRIDEEKEKDDNNNDSEKKSKWKLALTFDLEELGPVFIQVNLTPPTVSSIIWAEKQATLKLINQEAHNLRVSFSELGLTVEDITCRQGQPNMRKTRLDQQIVDIKA